MKQVIRILIVAGLFVQASVFAGSDQEYTALSRLLVELNALDSIINEAKHSSRIEKQTRFNYSALRHDLDVIKAGIQEYLDTPRREPRALPSLDGDYKN